LLGLACVAEAAPIRNVIICIGDGMGTGQVAAARCYAGTNLVFEGFPYQSRVATVSAGGALTDSAAASTAMATGRKVYNEVVSLALPGEGEELETLLERFSRLDKRTGLVTTSYLTDATPACFAAHASNRYDYAEIAGDYLEQTRPNVLLGGGGGGLSVAAAEAAGYRVVTDAPAMLALRSGTDSHVAGLFGDGAMPYVYDGLGTLPTLAQMAGTALDLLAGDPDGFFLMVEGGLIDHACHAEDLPRCVAETLAFSEAVRVLSKWAEGRRDTLVLVTADHETGGLAVLADNGAGVLPDVAWQSWGQHTTAPVGLYGFGVNAEQVLHVADNTEVRQVAGSEALMPATGVGIERFGEVSLRTHWAVNSGDVCRVECTPSLAPPSWQPCGTVTAESTRVVCETTNRTEGAKGFFRVITLSAAIPE
jgi:alkaline phosphatase